MILFLSSWHLVSVLGVFLGFSAFLGVAGILAQAWRVYEAHEDDETVKRARRSAAARRGHETRKAKMIAITPAGTADAEYRIDQAITPDDAHVGEDQ